MEWWSDPDGLTHACEASGYQAQIWYTSKKQWEAIVSQNLLVIDHRRWRTLDEAKGWCAIRLAEVVVHERQVGQ